ncbi:hypothetical protein FB645_002989 [Coemansia sp. IMI 203386]|nr:hypothetical protein FB645_002989 [Coemansia sp. IMI 203386]
MGEKNPDSHKLPMVISSAANIGLFGCYGMMIAFSLKYIEGAYLVPLVVNHAMMMLIIGILILVAIPGYTNGHKTFTMFKYPYDAMIILVFWHPLMAVLVISDSCYIQAKQSKEGMGKATVICIYCVVAAAGLSMLLNIYGLYTGKKPDKKADEKAAKEGGTAETSNENKD